MIVSCEKCRSQYRVKDERLPPQGGKIKCPKCQHIFVIFPAAQEVHENPTIVVPLPVLKDLVQDGQSDFDNLGGNRDFAKLEQEYRMSSFEGAFSSPQSQPSEEPVPDESTQPDFHSVPDFSASPASLDQFSDFSLKNESLGQKPSVVGQSRPSVDRPEKPRDYSTFEVLQGGNNDSDSFSTNVSPSEVGPEKKSWKLRSKIGIVYDFPSLSSLEGWLGARENFDGLMVANLDTGWKPIEGCADLFHPDLQKKFGRTNPGESPFFSSEQITPTESEKELVTKSPEKNKKPPSKASNKKVVDFVRIPPKRIDQQRKRQQKSEQQRLRILWVIVLIMLIAVIVHSLDLCKPDHGVIYNTSDVSDVDEEKSEETEKVNESNENIEENPDQISDSEELYHQYLKEAEEAIEHGDLERGAYLIDSALRLYPDGVEGWRRLSAVYDELGKKEEAKYAREQMRKLKQPPQ